MSEDGVRWPTWPAKARRAAGRGFDKLGEGADELEAVVRDLEAAGAHEAEIVRQAVGRVREARAVMLALHGMATGRAKPGL